MSRSAQEAVGTYSIYIVAAAILIIASVGGWRGLHLWSPGGFLLEALTPAGGDCVSCSGHARQSAYRSASEVSLNFWTRFPVSTSAV